MNTRLRGLWKKLKAVRVTLLLLFVCSFLTGCGVELTDLSLDRADTLTTVTGGVYDARREYLTQAKSCLSNRGIALALPEETNPDNAILDVENIMESENTLSTIKSMARCILMTSGDGRDAVSGSMTGKVTGTKNNGAKDGTYNFPYRFAYGTITSLNANGTPRTFSDGSNASYTGWVLWIDLTSMGTKANSVPWVGDANNDGIKVSLGLEGTWWSSDTFNMAGQFEHPAGENTWYNKFADEGNIIIAWETPDTPFEFESKTPPRADPVNDTYGAFGTGTVEVFTKAYSSHNGMQLVEALYGVSGASTVMAPSNAILNDFNEPGLWQSVNNGSGSFDGYARTGPLYADDGVTPALSSYNVYSWDGVNNNKILPGYEALTSSVIDYGSIWVLSPTASATQISDVQKKLNKYFGSITDANSNSFSTTVKTEGDDLDGGAVLNTAFERTELCVVPPGFGVLCYSVVPRTGFLNMTADINRDSSNVGLIRPVFASGENSNPCVGLGFIGPNPQVMRAMEIVLGDCGGGFAIVNQNIYLMTYPVSTVGYLYTNEGSSDACRAYIGLGAAPIYYNLVYDRLDYKYGESYQFTTTATAATDNPLYSDYNFVGGISVKDSTGTVQSSGGVYILQDEKGNNATCRVQIADTEDVEQAQAVFSDFVMNNWVHPVPLWDADPDTDGNQSYVFSDGKSAEDWLKDTALTVRSADEGVYFSAGGYGTKRIDQYLDAWANTLKVASLEVPQFVLMDYVETTLLPGATTTNNAILTGRKIRLLPDAIKYDATNHLYYYDGRTGLKIGEYVTTDGSRKIDDLFLGDIVDIRALCGVGYTKQAEGTTWTEVQPPYGYNTMFPIGVSFDAYKDSYANFIAEVDKAHGNTALANWISANIDTTTTTPIIDSFGTMNYWDGTSGTLADGSYYQSVAAVNAISSLTSATTDESGNSIPADAVVAVLNVNGADTKTHLGETEITQNTRIDELPYVCTNIITFSEPFPNTIFTPNDTKKVFEATEENMKTPNVMYTIAVGTGIQHGNFYHAWVTSEAPTDSLTWWNNYLDAHGFDYKLNVQVVKQYLETNYSYLANEDNRLRFDIVGAQYWSEELDVLNPNRGGNRTVNLVKTLSNVFGWLCIVYALICLLFWAIDIYAGLDKDFYKMLTGGRYVASAEAMPPTQSVHYATFLNALARSVIICIAGVVLIYIGAAVILAKMFKFLALVLRLVAGYWKR